MKHKGSHCWGLRGTYPQQKHSSTIQPAQREGRRKKKIERDVKDRQERQIRFYPTEARVFTQGQTRDLGSVNANPASKPKEKDKMF